MTGNRLAVVPATYVKFSTMVEKRTVSSIQIGEQFGSLVVRDDAGKIKRARHFLCECACGTVKPVNAYTLLTGGAKSCGCQRTAAMLAAPQPNRRFSPRTANEAIASIFSSSVPEPNSGCWIWLGHLDTDGYGRARFQAKEIKAHRLSYTVFCGEVPNGLSVLHGCDTRCCVNPEHLEPGTSAENSAQMVARGRSYRAIGDLHYTARKGSVNKGEKNPACKLTEQEVREIRAAPGTHKHIASRFGVTESNVQSIRSGRIWRHVK